MFLHSLLSIRKPRVLIVSPNFSGGGLETRINNIVNRLHDKYSFSLITKTPPENMRIKPSEHIKHIYSWRQHRKALRTADILDIHPFGVTNIVAEWNIPSRIKKIYTLHGTASLLENLDFLQDFNRVYTVSELLRPYIETNYPQIKDKLFLSKNCDVIKNYTSPTSTEKNILFSITNAKDQDFIQNIIDIIPSEYTVHIIGYFAPDSFVRMDGQIIYHGFVNIAELFNKNHFDIVFSRGGFATMDAVARNIACLCIYSDENGLYFEPLSRKNFKSLSDCNFVTRKKCDFKNIATEIKRIEKSPSDYQCRDLLIRHNNVENIPDLYCDL